MAFDPGSVIRPRTAGEVLDDAWRLCQADAAALLALTGLFHAPFAVCLLVMLTCGPVSRGASTPLAALTAGLLLLTGLGSGACQALFLRRAANEQTSFRQSLRAVLRRAPGHLAARAFVSVPLLLWTALFAWPAVSLGGKSGASHAGLNVLIVAACLFLPTWILGALGSSLDPTLAAGEGSFFAGVAATVRDLERQAGKALVVSLARVCFFLFAFFNLYVLLGLTLYFVENLGSVDLGVWPFQLGLENPAYVLSLLLLTWLLLVPYTEATRYLLYVDGRARYEGLDLWYRVRRLFAASATNRISMLVLAVGGVLLLTSAARASEEEQRLLQEVRAEVRRLRDAEPYPGGSACERQLLRLARRLDPGGSASRGSYRWFYRAAEEFHGYPPEQGRRILGELDASLRVVAEELARPMPRPDTQRIKGLVPPGDDEGAHGTSADKVEVKRPVRKEDEPPDNNRQEADGDRGTVQMANPVGGGSTAIWLLLAGLLLAVLGTAVVLFFRNREPRLRTTATKDDQGAREPGLGEMVVGPDARTATSLWRQADELARSGSHLQGLRMLYAAVLSMLHGARFIRYERTRTNGEYLGQLRVNAGEEVALPDRFRHLTRTYEVQWYGERDCGRSEYDACRELAEAIRDLVQ